MTETYLPKHILEGVTHRLAMNFCAQYIASELGYSDYDSEALGHIAMLTNNMLDPSSEVVLRLLRKTIANDGRNSYPETALRLLENQDYLDEMLEIYGKEIKPIMLAKTPYRE